jgi:hypothetical protein
MPRESAPGFKEWPDFLNCPDSLPFLPKATWNSPGILVFHLGLAMEMPCYHPFDTLLHTPGET